MIELIRSNTKLAINTSYRLNCKFLMAITKGSGTQACINMTDYRERNSYYNHDWSLWNVRSKSQVLWCLQQVFTCPIVQAQFVYWARLEEEEGMPFYHQASQEALCHGKSNLLHNVFCSFPNSFPKVSVINMFPRQKGQQCPNVFWRQDESPSLSVDIYA